jgi:thiol-disulfide isomerase/thioredoxin
MPIMLKRLYQKLLGFLRKLSQSDRKAMAFTGRNLLRFRQLLAGILIGAFLMLVGVEALDSFRWWWYSRNADDEWELPPPPIPPEIPVDLSWTIKTLDGQEFAMESTKGKVVFLNFWATWCGPCVQEMPSIQALYDQMKDEIAVVCISDEEAETVQTFIDEKGYTFPIYLIEGERPEDFHTWGIPATFILTPEGKMAFRHTGSAQWDHETSLNFIRRLL